MYIRPSYHHIDYTMVLKQLGILPLVITILLCYYTSSSSSMPYRGSGDVVVDWSTKDVVRMVKVS